ncbi:rubredoxin-NAD(+) reductase [Salinivibrio kushneri]|nr:rubredoxin-NAD(+) reductase [Salinivibrio kushneri]
MKKWLCIICGFIYDEAQGWPADGIPPGTAWEDVPENWVCPDCLVGKADFEMIEITEDIPEESVYVDTGSSEREAAVLSAFASSSAPIVIIGSGHSGYQLAAQLREHDASVAITVFTADDGALYSKPSLSNALTMAKDCNALQTASALDWEQRLNIRVYPNTYVEHIDRNTKTLETSIGHYRYSRLVIATGASPIETSIDGDCSYLFHVNNLSDYRQVRAQLTHKKRIAILGDGLIGCEFANDLIGSGYEVTVIGLGDWPMSRILPEKVGQALQKGLARLGVRWELQESIRRIEPMTESSARVYLTSGKYIDADLILSAVGLKPNVRLAEQAGLEVGRGIKVNQYGQTSDEHIFALGDCSETSQGWQPYIAPINQMVPAIAANLLGYDSPITLQPSPVIVKTPVLPLSVYPVPINREGRWVVEPQGNELTARFYSPEGEVLGFALLGKHVQALRGPWLQQLSPQQSVA